MKDFENVLQYFISHIESMRKALPLVMSLGGMIIDAVDNQYDKFMESEHVSIVEQDDEKTKFIIQPEKVKDYENIVNELESLDTAFNFMPKSIIVSLVSIYDAHIGNLIETMFDVKPELLNSLNKDVSFSDILKASSIGELKEDIIDKEINTVLRKSHLEQIDWFEKKLDITLRSDKDLIGRFAELTERRNLFVHSDGKVSTHYINLCKENGYKFDQEPCLGEKLGVEANYFARTVDTILEVGIKITHIIWRKLIPTQISLADENLTEITYNLIEKENYDLAKELLKFILSTKHYDPDYELVYLINLAQSFKWSGDDKKCKEIINSRSNWSLYKEKYQIARHVLLEEYDEVYELVRKYANDDNVITKQSIKEWPLYKKIRNDTKFIDLFENVYGEPLDFIDVDNKEIIEQIITKEEVAATDSI